MLRLAAVLALGFGLMAVPALAQDNGADTSTSGGSMGKLLAEGYEIKAAVKNGKKFLIFLQKDTIGYACEMAKLSSSQCGKIN